MVFIIWDGFLTDNLRMAVFESLCTKNDKKQKFKAVITTITQTEDTLPKLVYSVPPLFFFSQVCFDTLKGVSQADSNCRYCKRLKSPTFWGGEPELVVLSSLLKTPVHIYKSESEYGRYVFNIYLNSHVEICIKPCVCLIDV